MHACRVDALQANEWAVQSPKRPRQLGWETGGAGDRGRVMTIAQTVMVHSAPPSGDQVTVATSIHPGSDQHQGLNTASRDRRRRRFQGVVWALPVVPCV